MCIFPVVGPQDYCDAHYGEGKGCGTCPAGARAAVHYKKTLVAATNFKTQTSTTTISAVSAVSATPLVGKLRKENDQLKRDIEALHQKLENVEKDVKAKLKRLNDELKQAQSSVGKAEKKARDEAKAARRAKAKTARAQKAREDAIAMLPTVKHAQQSAVRNATRTWVQLQQAQKEVARVKKNMEHDSAADKVNLQRAENKLAKAKANTKEAVEKLQQTKKRLASAEESVKATTSKLTKAETEAKEAKMKQRFAEEEAEQARAAKNEVKKYLNHEMRRSKTLLRKIPPGTSHNDTSPVDPYPWLKPIFGSAFALFIVTVLGMIHHAGKVLNLAFDLREQWWRFREGHGGDSSADREDSEAAVVHDSSESTAARVLSDHRHSEATVAATGGGDLSAGAATATADP